MDINTAAFCMFVVAFAFWALVEAFTTDYQAIRLRTQNARKAIFARTARIKE